ncbi:MAG: 3-isopropylmalate dehydrogenase [Xanthomonadales bacterium]|nr:3-isopropylmalate dehydrogenase [Xanthomonadales bacterium]MCC6594424.1 3-isopropylmalate dehydrogenase [Xanthomonadales bacterium]MCE7931109.1 3-isopropylmalate dehydrogenase [Xanthomonadales bacterium PRO6]
MHSTITLLPGDGIGPEVVGCATEVLAAIAQRFGHSFDFHEALIGGAAIDATGDPLPDATLRACRESDAILLGAVGGPKWSDPNASVRPEQGLLKLRRELGLYANLRPVTVHPQLAELAPVKSDRLVGVDLLVVRELTGGIYFGEKRREGDVAVDVCSYSVAEVERVVRLAARLAGARKGRLTQVDKANVLETSRLWRQVTTRVVETEFPELQLEHQLVDSMAMHLIAKPAAYDVIVTENLFGDILTDEAGLLAGSLGLLPSASLGDGGPGVYEPIHGSAPDIAGQDKANPIGTILSAAMLLRWSLKLDAEARAIEAAVTAVLDAGLRTPDIAGDGPSVGTRAMTTAVLAEI